MVCRELESIPENSQCPPRLCSLCGFCHFESYFERLYKLPQHPFIPFCTPETLESMMSSSKATIANMGPMANSNSRHTAPRSPHTASPLLSALPNATDLFPRSIPFQSFLSTSTPSTNAPNSLGSASGGVGLGVGGASPPPSGPASYSSGGNYSGSSGNPRQIRGYPGFEEQFKNHSAPGNNVGYYNPTQRYAQGSPTPLSSPFGGLQSQLQPGEGNYACSFDTLDEPFGGYAGVTAGNGVGNSGGDNVICLGWEGGVDVWKIGKGVLEQVGRLEGLGGGVKSAKVDFLHSCNPFRKLRYCSLPDF